MVDALSNWPLAVPLFLGAGVFWLLALFVVAWFGMPATKASVTTTAQRVLANSAVPIAGQIVNRGVDLVFAVFVLRMLGATGNGQYAIAVITWLYIKTISDFGLGVLVTREAAQYPERSGQLLGTTTLLRLLILAALLPFVAIYAIGGQSWFNLSPESGIAIGLLMAAIVPGSYTEAVNSIFNSQERMTFPAILNVLTNFARAAFGLAALFSGMGVIGLALVAALSTLVSMLAFHLSLRHLSVKPRFSFDFAQMKQLLILAWPLLLNALLVNLFFRADTFIIQANDGDHAVGTYDAAFKFVNMLLLIPAYFTLAIFPILARHARSNTVRMVEHYQYAVKLMFIGAWPITLGTMALAPLLIWILGGDGFLPDSATALRVLIWFLPLSYVNGVTQYALIAINRQRTLTPAFALAVGFNLMANLMLVPIYGYLAAAAVTVATEVVLFLPLAHAVKKYLGEMPWFSIAIRPLGAAVVFGVVLLALMPVGVYPALAAGLIAYVVALVVLGGIGEQEWDLVRDITGRKRAAVGDT